MFYNDNIHLTDLDYDLHLAEDDDRKRLPDIQEELKKVREEL